MKRLSGFTALIFGLTLGMHMSVQAQTTVDSPVADQTLLTIYPRNLAMVTEVRKINVPAGVSTIRFMGVSDQIISQTAVLESFEGVSLERNFDSDLITQATLLNEAIGETVTLRRVNPATGAIRVQEAQLISAPKNTQYTWQTTTEGAIFEIDGQIEALECAGLYETLLFSGLPKTLNPAPVLSMVVRSEIAGPREITISYLTQGLSWSADYRLDADKTHTSGALSGWLTMTNSTSKSFENVPTAIIAGKLNRSSNTRAEKPQRNFFSPTCWPKGSTKKGIRPNVARVENQRISYGWDGSVSSLVAPAPQMAFAQSDEVIVTATKRAATLEEFGDYKLYRVPQPITVAAYQTKQIAFLNVPDAEIERVFKFDYDAQYVLGLPDNGNIVPANVDYEIDNSRDGKLAKPLPRGTVRVMTPRPNGQTAYLGEDKVLDLAIDLPVEVTVSKSSNVQMRASYAAIMEGESKTLRLLADISNATPDAVVAEIEFSGDNIRAGDIGTESHPRDSSEIIPTYKIPIAPSSREEFFIDLPVERRFMLNRSNMGAFNYKVGYTFSDTASGEYRLGSQVGGDDWLTGYFPNDEKRTVEVLTTKLRHKEFKGPNGEDMLNIRERFVFKNTSEGPARVWFEFPDSNERDTILISATESPISQDPIRWSFLIGKGQSKTLEVHYDTED